MKTLTRSLLALVALTGTLYTTPVLADGDKCDKAERNRQEKEIDHATGKASEKDLKDARDRVTRDCPK